ncbi:MAG: gluconokinase [Planctomycetaceae bacterium]
MIIVLWGVSGCGKSTVGQQLAQHLDWVFFDADDFHPQANIEKMRQGIPLNDEDRYPWLDGLESLIRGVNDEGRNGVLACSALKENYRRRLGINQQDIRGVHLSGSEELIQSRLAARNHEFMNKKLLSSQIAILEPADEGLALNISLPPAELCRQIVDQLNLSVG